MLGKRDNRTTPRPRGFTLIELLVVIAVIALLVGIAAPSLWKATAIARNAKTQAFITTLSGGASQYWLDTGKRYYPGQRYPDELAGSSGSYTGSQVLGASVFGFTYQNITDGDAEPSSGYVDYQQEMLFNPGTPDRPYTISDLNNNPMPILYYPARLGQTGTDQYKFADNGEYIEDHTDWPSADYLKTPTGNVVRDQQFLIIGAGLNRKFFDDDDLTNW